MNNQQPDTRTYEELIFSTEARILRAAFIGSKSSQNIIEHKITKSCMMPSDYAHCIFSAYNLLDNDGKRAVSKDDLDGICRAICDSFGIGTPSNVMVSAFVNLKADKLS